MKKLLIVTAMLVTPSLSWAMCIATAPNLVLLRVDACQSVEIDASYSRPPAHASHERGTGIRGVLITGWVLKSELVWDGNAETADYLMDMGKASVDKPGTFFLEGRAYKVCPTLVGTEKTFISERPCCDVIPAKGICLAPSPIAIVREENVPQQWRKWEAE